MPTPLGDTTKTLFLKSESHKLFQEFEVKSGGTIYKGQPVQLTTSGTVEAASSASTPQTIIGVSMHSGTEGELVTVMMKAYAIIFAEAGTASLVPGPVKIHTTAYNATSGYVEVDDAIVDATNQVGWAIDGGDAGDVIRLALL